MYTNGTMGEPKGVLITQKNNVVTCINGLDQFMHDGDEDKEKE
jgi:long-subunit acyl-CoA synthetase (AMP-forming)